jgi:hypothetical protein
MSAVAQTPESIMSSASGNNKVYQFQLDRKYGVGLRLDSVLSAQDSFDQNAQQLPRVSDVRLVFVVQRGARLDTVAFRHGTKYMLVNDRSVLLDVPLLRGLAKFLPYNQAMLILEDPKLEVNE